MYCYENQRWWVFSGLAGALINKSGFTTIGNFISPNFFFRKLKLSEIQIDYVLKDFQLIATFGLMILDKFKFK